MFFAVLFLQHIECLIVLENLIKSVGIQVAFLCHTEIMEEMSEYSFKMQLFLLHSSWKWQNNTYDFH